MDDFSGAFEGALAADEVEGVFADPLEVSVRIEGIDRKFFEIVWNEFVEVFWESTGCEAKAFGCERNLGCTKERCRADAHFKYAVD